MRTRKIVWLCAFLLLVCIIPDYLAHVLEPPEDTPTDKAVMETLWNWERFAEAANAAGGEYRTGLYAHEIAERVNVYNAYSAIADLKRLGRIYQWDDGTFHLWLQLTEAEQQPE